MPESQTLKTTKKPPKYRRQKRAHGGDSAFVEVPGHGRKYLGVWGTRESHDAYARAIREWQAGVFDVKPPRDLAVVEVVAKFLRFARSHYRGADGKKTSQFANYKIAARPLRKLYGRTAAAEFGPKKLKAVREEMIRLGWSRGVCNQMTQNVRRIFKWAASEELVPEPVFKALMTVEGLKKNRTAAPERPEVEAVADDVVEATKRYLPKQVRDMIDVQRLAGMRPTEVCLMRACDINMTGAIWLYTPHRHKTEHLDHKRIIPLGPKAQAIIGPYLMGRAVTAHLFDPREVVREQRAAAATKGQRRRKNQKKATPKSARRVRGHYDRDSYRRVITRACIKAKADDAAFPSWHPHQLRHSFGDQVRAEFDLDAAQAALGHRHASTSEIYARVRISRAEEVALRIG